MNIQVNKHQLERVVIKWLDKHFGDLTIKTSKDYPDSVFYVNSDNEIFMDHNKKNKVIWIDYDKIWSKLESLFYLKNGNVRLIMKDWLKEHYNLSGVTPRLFIYSFPSTLEED
jgi:hypothetical protein